MEHNKDIGKAIREKLEPLDRSPRHDLWQAIEADLPKKRRRRIPPFWLMFISILVVTSLIYVASDGFGGKDMKNPDAVNRGGNVDSYGNENGSGLNSGSVDANGNPDNDSASESKNADVQNEKSPVAESDGFESGENKILSDRKSNVNDNYSQNSENQDQARKSSKKKGSGKSRLASAKKGVHSKTVSEASNNEKVLTGDSFTANAGKIVSSLDGNAGLPISDNGKTSPEKNDMETTADSIQKAIAEEKLPTEKPKDSTKTDELEQVSYKTFSIFLYAAPTYFNTFSRISSIDNRLDTVSRRAEITFNYGGYIVLPFDEKWSVRTGVSRTDLRHRTKGIPVNTLAQQNYYNVEYAPGINNAVAQQRFANSQRFDLVQDISYLEFPIELKYKLTEKTIGIEAIGGISAAFLKDNTVTAESDSDGSVILGSTRDFYKVYVSANIGAGFYYRFTDYLRLNVEPMFKYHFRTASTALQPYSVVVMGGIEYTFNWRQKNKKESQK